MIDFQTVTELPGAPISSEQLERLVNRYVWASEYCRGRDVVEAACGAGPGLGILASAAKSLEAGDLSSPILERAKSHYKDRMQLQQFDAQKMPFAGGSKDVVVLFEAIYYLPEPDRFVKECMRILRPGGRVLVVSANKDLWDFHPSEFSHGYFGVRELAELFERQGFSCDFFGLQPVDRLSLRQKVLRPLKRMAVNTGLMPRTMSGKRWLKRIVFGAEVQMPAELMRDMAPYSPPDPLRSREPDRRYKIIYCVACVRPQS